MASVQKQTHKTKSRVGCKISSKPLSLHEELCMTDSSGEERGPWWVEEHDPWWVDSTAVEVRNTGSPNGSFVFKKEDMKLGWG